jgi:hypothetical protein
MQTLCGHCQCAVVVYAVLCESMAVLQTALVSDQLACSCTDYCTIVSVDCLARTATLALCDNRGAHASTHAAVNFSTLVKRALSRRHRVTDAAAIESAWSSLVQSYTQTGKSLLLVTVTWVTALCQFDCMNHRKLPIS